MPSQSWDLEICHTVSETDPASGKVRVAQAQAPALEPGGLGGRGSGPGSRPPAARWYCQQAPSCPLPLGTATQTAQISISKSESGSDVESTFNNNF